ncbi:MAG: hypothetical protein ABSG33_10065 [Candidatus Bathyarchaeia archaeon]
MSSIKKTDDYLHVAEDSLDWRESYYFNFVDAQTKTSGFSTIGILPNQKKGEFILALFHEDKLNIHYKEQTLTDEQSSSLLSDGALTYKLVEPLRKWDITVADQNLNVHLKWEARFPPFDFGKGSGTSWKGHFEQSGIVEGEAALSDGTKIRIHGFSQRDKSWGPRDWFIENWFALHAQFETYAVGLRKDTVNGASYVSGGLSSASKQAAASQIDLQIKYDDEDGKNPVGASTTIHYEDGRVDTFISKLISPKSFFKFSRSFPKGTTELFEGMAVHESVATGEKGTGLIEFLFTHPKP